MCDVMIVCCLQEDNTVLLQTKNDLFAELAATADTLIETEEKVLC